MSENWLILHTPLYEHQCPRVNSCLWTLLYCRAKHCWGLYPPLWRDSAAPANTCPHGKTKSTRPTAQYEILGTPERCVCLCVCVCLYYRSAGKVVYLDEGREIEVVLQSKQNEKCYLCVSIYVVIPHWAFLKTPSHWPILVRFSPFISFYII